MSEAVVAYEYEVEPGVIFITGLPPLPSEARGNKEQEDQFREMLRKSILSQLGQTLAIKDIWILTKNPKVSSARVVLPSESEAAIAISSFDKVPIEIIPGKPPRTLKVTQSKRRIAITTAGGDQTSEGRQQSKQEASPAASAAVPAAPPATSAPAAKAPAPAAQNAPAQKPREHILRVLTLPYARADGGFMVTITSLYGDSIEPGEKYILTVSAACTIERIDEHRSYTAGTEDATSSSGTAIVVIHPSGGWTSALCAVISCRTGKICNLVLYA